MHCYLDNAATTKTLPQAAEAAIEAMTESYGNPSSLHRLGLEAAKGLKEAREKIAETMGCFPEEIIFTSGGTESVNTAIIGAANKMYPKYNHIVSTSIEHKAVLNTLKKLMNKGFKVTYVAPRRDGTIQAEDILNEVNGNTGLVCVMAVNNETGAVMPIADIKSGLNAKSSRALLFSDTVQANFKLGLPLAKLNMDMATVSGHKIGAPKGIGALYIKKGIRINPLLNGGGQENDMRSGTEPMPLIKALAAAASYRFANMAGDIAHIRELNRYLKERLAAELPQARLISPDSAVPHILCFSLPDTRSEVNVRLLSDRGVYISGGSACSKGKPSYVLSAMNLPSDIASGAMRVSFCPENTADDVDALIDGLKEVWKTFNI